MKRILLPMLLFLGMQGKAQELYVYSEPASNIPAHSISGKISAGYMREESITKRLMQRYMPEIMFGLNKNLMLKLGSTFGNVHTTNLRWESLYLYGKYRFLSKDELHRHFRMAVFAEAAYSRNPYHFDEINIQGDKSGLQAGVIATQLWHKFALSATVSHTQALHPSRKNELPGFVGYPYSSLNYSISAGYLLLPREYTDYRQLNLNLYMEFLAQQGFDPGKYYYDIAPAIQFIFNSNTKVNLGYRFELESNMARMARSGWHVSIERTFLNALK